jgi:two-component system cell cycle sensor histidine kinase/response regulator CckA
VTALSPAPDADAALRFLAHATAELARSLDCGDAIRTVVRLMVPAVADWCTVELADDAGRLELAGGERGSEPLDTLALPLVARGRTLGILTLGCSPATGRSFPDGDLALMEELAARAAVAIDNALLHRAEQRAQERYRAFIEQTSEAVWRFELKEPVPVTLPEDQQLAAFYGARLAECNDATARMYGHQRAADIVGLRADQFLDRADPHNDAYLRAFIQSGYRLVDAESHELAADGSSRWFLNNLIGFVESGALVRAWGTQRDITDRMRTQQTLRASEARLRTIVDSNMIGIAFWDGERVTDANDVLLRMLGYTRADLEAGLLRRGRLTPPEYGSADATALAEAMSRGSCTPYEKEFLRKDGSRLPALAGGALFPEGGGVFFVLDLTELRRIQEQLHAAQRMDAVGRLAGGVAHEINNALQAVIGFAAFALREVAPEHPAREDLAEVDRAARRAATITQQLLAFGRRQVLRPVSLDLNQLVSDFTPVLRRALGPEHRLVVREALASIPVVADRGQLEQVLLNLALNARDAMPGAGTLTIRVGRMAVLPPHARAAGPLRPGPYAALEVIDTGQGMDSATRSRVFEPFFTTKEAGSGTGLGLSVVHGIVAQSGGAVVVVSEPGFGAAFTVLLPEAGGWVSGQPDDATTPEPGAGHETVLVVDDDPMVLDVTRRALTEHGYYVLAAASPADALRVAERTSIDLLVTDVVMPGTSGSALADALAATRPGGAPPVLYISGYTGDEVIRQRLLRPEQPFLQKPFDGDLLARRVRRLLDERTAPGA